MTAVSTNNLRRKSNLKHTNKQKGILFIDNVLKMKIPPKVITLYRSKATPIRIPMVFFADIEETHSKTLWNLKGHQNHQNNLKKEWNWKTHTHWSENWLQSYSNQRGCYCHKDRQTNRIKHRAQEETLTYVVAMDYVSVSPNKIHRWTLIPRVMVFGGENFEK